MEEESNIIQINHFMKGISKTIKLLVEVGILIIKELISKETSMTENLIEIVK